MSLWNLCPVLLLSPLTRIVLRSVEWIKFLLTFASTANLASESHRTHDHILLSLTKELCSQSVPAPTEHALGCPSIDKWGEVKKFVITIHFQIIYECIHHWCEENKIGKIGYICCCIWDMLRDLICDMNAWNYHCFAPMSTPVTTRQQSRWENTIFLWKNWTQRFWARCLLFLCDFNLNFVNRTELSWKSIRERQEDIWKGRRDKIDGFFMHCSQTRLNMELEMSLFGAGPSKATNKRNTVWISEKNYFLFIYKTIFKHIYK
jgi:hypothetical protein